MSLICDGAAEAHNFSQPVLYKVVVTQATNYLKGNSASEFHQFDHRQIYAFGLIYKWSTVGTRAWSGPGLLHLVGSCA